VGRYRFTAGALAVLACAVFAALASALAPGDFDPSFASGGTFIQPLGEGTRPGAVLNAVAMQPDGKIVVTGVASDNKEVVASLNPDGTLDPAFGTGGKVLTTFGTGSSDIPFPQALAIQPDGKIVIGGFVSGATQRLLLARLNADGSFDAAFGSNGVVVTQLGEGTNPYSGAFAVVLRPDGRILTAGGARTSGNQGAVLVARWNTDGSPDSSFGTNGKATPQLGEGANANSGAFDLALQPDGKIVIAGSATDTNGTQADAALVARLDGDGMGLDASFGSGGKVLGRLGQTSNDIMRPEGLALQPDGKIVLGGQTVDAQSHHKIFVSRLNVDGNGLDSGFVGGGTLITQLGEGGNPYSDLTRLALQPDGKIVGVGNANGPQGDTQVLVARVKADGTLDSSFSGDGKVLTQLAVANSFFTSLVLDPNGKVVAAGSVQDNTPDNHALISRLILELAPAASFTTAPNPVDPGQPVAFDGTGSTDPDGTVVSYAWDFGDGATATGATASHSYASSGMYAAKLTVRDDYGASSSSSQTITVNPLVPVLGALTMKPRRFPAAAKGASIARRKTGTTISYTDTQAATTTFTVARVLRGRRGGKRGTRFVQVPGSFSHVDSVGANEFHFTGRVDRRKLPPGKYQLSATPEVPGYVGGTVATRFRVIP